MSEAKSLCHLCRASGVGANCLCHLCCVTCVWAIVCAICAVLFALELTVCASCAVSLESEAKCLCHLCCATCAICAVSFVCGPTVCAICVGCAPNVCAACAVCVGNRLNQLSVARLHVSARRAEIPANINCCCYDCCGSLNVDMLVVCAVVDVFVDQLSVPPVVARTVGSQTHQQRPTETPCQH